MNNLFGTDGIRKRVGTYPLTTSGIVQIGSAIARWAINKYSVNPHIAIATDTRASRDFIKAGLKAGLLQHGVTVYDAGILPTPGMYHLVKHTQQFHAGIVISASHNQYADNGIKLIDSHQLKISTHDELLLSQLIESVCDVSSEGNFGQDVPLLHAGKLYAKHILASFDYPFLTNRKIVLDCANGATSPIAPHIFFQLGAQVVTINNKPNGTNINAHCGSVHPNELQKKVIHTHADMGFAFDGDGDRVIAVSRTGQIKDGDHLLALLQQHSHYNQLPTLVGTIMSNQGLAHHLEQQNKQFVRTNVGDKYVCEYLNNNKLLLGAEPSGHVILADYLPAADGIFTALKVAQAMYETNNWDMQTFTAFPQQLTNMLVTKKYDLATEPFNSLIKMYNNMLQAGRIIVRYSGTENMLRVMVEDMHEHTVTAVSKQLGDALIKAHEGSL